MCLVRAEQGQEEVVVLAGEALEGDHLPADGRLARGDGVRVALAQHRRVDLEALFAQDLVDLRHLRGDDGERAGLDDALLLVRDVLDRVTEQPLVIERHGRDDADDAVGDVRRVPRAAEADLDDCDVDGRVREHGVGEDDDDLEVRHPHAAVARALVVDDRDERFDVVPHAHESFDVDGFAVDADALTAVVQVR